MSELQLTQYAVTGPDGAISAVIEAPSAEVALERARVLQHELPDGLPHLYTVAPYEDVVRSSWFGDAWFELRAEIERLAATDGPPFLSTVRGSKSEES